MKDEDMFQFDFNGIKVLKVLGEERSTKKAAERLFIGQSAVSKALKKLRIQFNDPLFTRKLNTLVPTPKCEEILQQLPSLLDNFNNLFIDKQAFEPSTLVGSIRIHINATLCFPIMDAIFQRLTYEAPNATIQLENWSHHTEQAIKQGLVDLGINFFPLELSKEIIQTPICSPKFKLCCSSRSPLANIETPTIDDIADLPYALMVMPNYTTKGNYLEAYLRQKGYQPTVRLRSDKMHVCLNAIQEHDCVMPVSEIVGPALPSDLILKDISHFEDINHYQISHFISYRLRSSAHSQWLARIVEEVVSGLVPMP
ncbi:LysR family transcriptional regulator [Vibrio mexicanus]|uniref:LysR substrate-binding domain-containing protein n=1 Tax=Vibrio mexicanus TaxID=1004326 RepID=UPI000AF8590C|nr:LysR family transcriptional regulator [Vibrio mexicanus]